MDTRRNGSYFGTCVPLLNGFLSILFILLSTIAIPNKLQHSMFFLASAATVMYFASWSGSKSSSTPPKQSLGLWKSPQSTCLKMSTKLIFKHKLMGCFWWVHYSSLMRFKCTVYPWYPYIVFLDTQMEGQSQWISNVTGLVSCTP